MMQSCQRQAIFRARGKCLGASLCYNKYEWQPSAEQQQQQQHLQPNNIAGKQRNDKDQQQQSVNLCLLPVYKFRRGEKSSGVGMEEPTVIGNTNTNQQQTINTCFCHITWKRKWEMLFIIVVVVATACLLASQLLPLFFTCVVFFCFVSFCFCSFAFRCSLFVRWQSERNKFSFRHPPVNFFDMDTFCFVLLCCIQLVGAISMCMCVCEYVCNCLQIFTTCEGVRCGNLGTTRIFFQNFTRGRNLCPDSGNVIFLRGRTQIPKYSTRNSGSKTWDRPRS